MAPDSDGAEVTTLAPDDAFAVLGNESRMDILQTLAESDDTLSFSELRERIGIRDSGQFNYHLDKLVGHFVADTDDGYTLRQAGQRVVEAIVSGAVTESVIVDSTRLASPCPYCGAPIEASYREETLVIRCTACVGSFADAPSKSGFGRLPEGTLTVYQLPSAAIQESLEELLANAIAWTYIEMMAVINGICPRCAGQIEHSLDLCTDHERDSEICTYCNGRFAIRFTSQCTICGMVRGGTIKHQLMVDPRVRSFFETRGVDTLTPTWEDMTVFYR